MRRIAVILVFFGSLIGTVFITAERSKTNAATYTITNLGSTRTLSDFYCGTGGFCSTTVSQIFYGNAGDVFDFGWYQPYWAGDSRYMWSSGCDFIDGRACFGVIGYSTAVFVEPGGTGLAWARSPRTGECYEFGVCDPFPLQALVFTLPEGFAGIQLALVNPGTWIAPVPVPPALVLFGSALFGIGIAGRARRLKSQA